MLNIIPVNKKATMPISILKSKKQVAVLATSTSITKKKTEELEQVSCI